MKRFDVVHKDGVCRQVKRKDPIRIPKKLHLEDVCDVFVQAPEDMDAPVHDEAASSKEAPCAVPVGERRSHAAVDVSGDSIGPSSTKRRVVRSCV